MNCEGGHCEKTSFLFYLRGGVKIKKQENLGLFPKKGGGGCQKKNKNVSNSNSDI